MKLIKLIFCCITYISWAQSTDGKATYIVSDKTEFVDIYPDVSQTFPSTKFEWKQITPYRSTIINDKQKLSFSIRGKKSNSVYEWKVFRSARDTEEFDSLTNKYRLNIIADEQLKEQVYINLNNGTRLTNRVTLEANAKTDDFSYKFFKISANDTRTNNNWNHLIYDLYIINLYENGVAIDYLYVFVLPKADKNYRERFDSYVDPPDDIGNYRPVGYPKWYGHGYNLIEHIDRTHRYGVFFKASTTLNKSRKGRGMVSNQIPSINNLFIYPTDETQKYWSRATRNAIIHPSYHLTGRDVYYGISIKIPQNQNWDWIENDKNEQSTVILLELHTADFPNRELPVNEGQNLQIAYMGKNKFRMNYGITKLAKFQKDLYLNTNEEEWIDFIFRFKYKNAEFKHLTKRDFKEENGLFEMWISVGNDNFQKVSFKENTYPFENIDGQKFVPKLSEDKLSVYGPNIVNTNPVYFIATQYRIVNGLPKPINVDNVVYYDEFITSDNLKPILRFFNKKVLGISEFSGNQ